MLYAVEWIVATMSDQFVLQRRGTVTAQQCFDKDNTARDSSSNQCHASGLFDGQRASLD